MTEADGDHVRRGWPGARRVAALIVVVVLAWSAWVSARVALAPNAEPTWGATTTDEAVHVLYEHGRRCNQPLGTPSVNERV